MVNDFIIPASVMKLLFLWIGQGSKSFQGGEHMGMWGEWRGQRGHGCWYPFPIPCPMYLFHLAVPDLHPSTIYQQSSE